MAETGNHNRTGERALDTAYSVKTEAGALGESAAHAPKVRVLIADDQQIACEVLKRLLRTEQDVELVATCSSGAEALESIKKLDPDLVFMDVQMPGMDGFEVLEKLPPGRSPIVVFVTANEAHAGRAEKANAGFVLKPCTRERIRTALRHALARRLPAHRADDF